jgi:hypothetical protein
MSETRRVSCQNKFVKLVHLFGFITKKNAINVFHFLKCYFTVLAKVAKVSAINDILS